MKSFYRIALVMVLLLGLFQAAGSLASRPAAGGTGDVYVTVDASLAGIQAPTCTGLKSWTCIQPTVGWNS